MTNTILGLIAAAVLMAIGFFSSRRTAKQDAEVLDLTVKIKQNQTKAGEAQKNADQKTKEYLDALKAYDPNFHSDDDGGKPSA